MKESTKNKIKSLLKKNRVFLFMKGTPRFPQCGFSARAVEVLKSAGAKFNSFDVLEDQEIREGIKEYGEFPTIPQLYINQKLVGGSDILMDLYETGELQTLIQNKIF